MSEVCYSTFFEQYDKWLEDCLTEYEEKFGQPETDQLIEFGENGDAYPHGIGGIGWIRNCVTPWKNSKHFVE